MSGQWPPEWEDSDTGLPDEWTDSDAGLDPEASEVTLFLASVPGPVLPASFEARISAAIAAEATARANGTASAGTEPPAGHRLTHGPLTQPQLELDRRELSRLALSLLALGSLALGSLALRRQVLSWLTRG